jgi:hypothetical protein
MSIASKSTSLQNYNMLLYRTALHPEFFTVQARKHLKHGEYDFEAWVFQGGHCVRFEHQGICVTEVVTDAGDKLPDRALVTTLPCAGERDHESEFSDRITYMTSVQTENLSDHLYSGTFDEMLEHGRLSDAIMSVWRDDQGRRNMSLVDVQRYGDEVHVQGYHLRSDCCLVLRTQTIFQVGVHKTETADEDED